MVSSNTKPFVYRVRPVPIEVNLIELIVRILIIVPCPNISSTPLSALKCVGGEHRVSKNAQNGIDHTGGYTLSIRSTTPSQGLASIGLAYPMYFIPTFLGLHCKT